MAENQPTALQVRRITLGFLIAWAWTIFAGVGGIAMFAEGNGTAGVFCILSAAVACPAVNSFSEAHFRFGLSGWVRLIIVIVLLVLSGSNLKTPATSMPASSLATNTVGTEQVSTRHTPQVLLAETGNGTKTTEKFTAAGDWDLNYQFDCSNFGQQGNFQVFVYNGDGSLSFSNSGVNQLAASGADVDHYHSSGAFYLVVNSECRWQIKVSG